MSDDSDEQQKDHIRRCQHRWLGYRCMNCGVSSDPNHKPLLPSGIDLTNVLFMELVEELKRRCTAIVFAVSRKEEGLPAETEFVTIKHSGNSLLQTGLLALLNNAIDRQVNKDVDKWWHTNHLHLNDL